jgi:uncharacterized RDD family membrane protein YckC
MSQSIYPHSSPDWLQTRGVITRRIFALFADLILINILALGAAIFITLFGLLTFGIVTITWHIIPWLPLLYFAVLVGSDGGTLGQRLFGLRVRQDANLAPPTLAQALVWALLLWLSFYLACIPFAWVLFNPRHRALHDVLSGLVVIRPPQISY